MKNFYEMLNLIELSQAIGKQDPVPLSQVPLNAAKAAVSSGRSDGAPPADDQAQVELTSSGPVAGLRPTQSQLKSSNFVGMIISNLAGAFDLKDMKAIVSGDNAIMDGHHRWAAALVIDPNQTVKYTKINLPLEKLITLLNVYTVGKLGNRGKDAKGESIKAAFSNAKSMLQNALNEGWKGQQNYTPEQVAQAYGNVPGANKDPKNGLSIMQQNIDKILNDSSKTSPATNLPRKDMPVIEIGEQAKPAIEQLVKDLQQGNVDHMQPFSQEVYRALKVDSSVTQQNVGANQQGQVTQQNVGANQQGQVTQQNVGANQNQVTQKATVQQQVRPNNQVLQRQVASNSHEGPKLNEWLTLAGIHEHKN